MNAGCPCAPVEIYPLNYQGRLQPPAPTSSCIHLINMYMCVCVCILTMCKVLWPVTWGLD